MESITWEQFQTAFQTAPEAVRGIVNSEVIPDLVDELIGEYHIAPEYRSSLIERIGDSALSLTSIVQTLEIVAIPDGSRARFLQKIQNTITPGATPIPTIQVNDVPVLTTDMPSASQAQPAIRTMEQDIGNIHGYGAAATQGAAIATKEEPVVRSTSQAELQGRNVGVPNYTPEA